ncbi:MAG: primosomal protein N' [Proteobacteria bacterium SG_bin7]|nr:MAG: primosomal protein N' [Proteobacteria bacterium SG_bin7]
MSEVLLNVAVNAPLFTTLTYSSDLDVPRGQPVIVPLGKRTATGVVMGTTTMTETPREKIKSIKQIHEEWPRLNENFVKWLEWLASYYQYPIGQVTDLAFPPLKKETKRAAKKDPIRLSQAIGKKHRLTNEQEKCFRDMSKKTDFNVHLLFGVTGSGKTEVYLELFEKTVNEGRQGVFLVPEISLTPQLIQRFGERFGDAISVIHSHLTPREKTKQWWEMVEGKKKILLGARSALFCPVPNLGMIIVDEEHEPSFKQDEKLKYHARDAAIMQAKIFNCPIILGSATPAMETWQNAKSGKYQIHRMSRRVENRKMPDIQIVDLKKNPKGAGMLPFWLSPTLHKKIEESLNRREQVALFLNRRGTAQLILCPACGESQKCPNCSVTLTLHGTRHLLCHYCDYHEVLGNACTFCKNEEIKKIGLGTERVEEDMRSLFPNARIARADRDEIQNRTDLEDLISSIENRQTDIIVGTQMIAKGLDFKGLNLVGLVLADIGFNMPDFRASERSFQLILQVSGRAGRHVSADEQPGQVIVQTFNPEHLAVVHAQKNDYEGFAETELGFRKALGYPPFGKLAAVRIKSNDKDIAEKSAQQVLAIAQKLQGKDAELNKLEILGPTEAPLSKLKGQYRYHLLVKGDSPAQVQRMCASISQVEGLLSSKTKLQIDIDPLSLL